MATTYLSRTPASAGNRRKFTISLWVKRVKLGIDQYMVQAGSSGSEFDIRFNTDDKLRFSEYASSSGYGLITNRRFRDTAAWMHLVFTYDSAQSTDTDRNKIYVNGEQISASDCTAYDSGKHPPQNNDNAAWNNTTELRINDRTWNTSSPQDALYTHIHHTDGYAYAASDFGETDSTSGIWKAKPSPSITYGTNGFFLKFENSGNLDLDSSGNNLTFTTSGTLTQNVDTPSNNFCTMNPLDNYYFGGTFSNGNNTVQSASSSYSYCSSTIHVSSGKWYWEIKADSPDSSMRVGIGSKLATSTSDNLGNDTDGEAVVYPSGATKVNNVDDPNSWSGTSWTTGDILGFAMDLDNNKLYISKNGTFMNSGSPTSGSTGTGALSITAPASTPTGAYFVGWGDNNSSGTATMSHNFGNGYFGTTAVASANADGNGFGAFEYTVPTGYYSLCTKNIKEFG
jgi:hypothetical protein